jgi:hypothetical protein
MLLPPTAVVAVADTVVVVAADTVVVAEADAAVVEAAITAAVVGAGITSAAAAGTSAVVAVDTPADTSAVDLLRPHTSVRDTSRLDMDPVRTSRLDIGPMYTSQVDTAGISGTAVGGITALARAGYGRNITASTSGSAIKVLQSGRRIGGLVILRDHVLAAVAQAVRTDVASRRACYEPVPM